MKKNQLRTIQLKCIDKRLGNEFPMPGYATPGSAGMDISACIDEPLEIKPGETLTITWQTNKEINWVYIFLYRKSTQELSIVVRKMSSNEYFWVIPPDLHWSLHYSIKIQNHYDNEEFGFSDTFSIIVRS